MFRTIISLFFILLLIIIAVILFLLFNSKQGVDFNAFLTKCKSVKNRDSKDTRQEPEVSGTEKQLIDELKQLKKEVVELKQKVSQIETKRNQDVKAINDSFKIINEKLANVASQKSKEVTSEQVATTPKVTVVNVEKYPKVMYAHYADNANPVGFSQSLLKLSSEGCFFKITIQSPTQASFSLIDDEDIMLNAVQALATIVTPCCVYNIAEPITNRYKTIAEGKLTKLNDLWQVETKSKISFL